MSQHTGGSGGSVNDPQEGRRRLVPRACAGLVAGFVVIPLALSAAGSGRGAERHKNLPLQLAAREISLLAPQIVEAIHLEPGDVVVSFGATFPTFLNAIKGSVGPEGAIYAIFRRPAAYREMLENGPSRYGEQVIPIFAADGDAHLESGIADVVVALDLYAFFSREQDVYRQARRALRPGGRLVQIRAKARTQREQEQIYPGLEGPVQGHAKALEANRQRMMVERAGFRYLEELSLLEARTIRIFQRTDD